MEIQKDMEVDGSHIRAVQKTEDSTRVLDYDYKKCNGCGICVALCPKKALQSGPLLEIATGLDAPPVLIDLDACVFCGMCANFCPVNAYSFTVNGCDISQDDNYPRLLRSASPNEKCLPCGLCQPVCPTKAIDVTFKGTRGDYGPLRKDVSGKIVVDREKCNLCGICPRFCPAFIMMEKESGDPRNLIPFDQLLIDEELCDYCGLCVGLCPEKAITVEGEPISANLEFKGTIQVDEGKCIGCGRCALVCPYEAIDVTRPFEGDIRLLKENLTKCDPLGCHGCFNVCPANCWYVDDSGKVEVVKDQCILCGACQQACHCLAIDVERSNVSHSTVKETPWASEWKDAIASILTGEKRRPDVSGAVSPPEVVKQPLPEIEIPMRDPHLLTLIDQRLKMLEPAMSKANVRYIWERLPPASAAEKIAARAIGKSASKAAMQKSLEDVEDVSVSGSQSPAQGGA